MLALATPWVLLILSLAVVVLCFRKKWVYAILTLGVVVLINWYSQVFCFGFRHDLAGDVKVLSFNVNCDSTYDRHKFDGILSLVKKEEPDILFFTEFFGDMGDSLHLKLRTLYPYSTRAILSHNVIYSMSEIKEKKVMERVGQGSSYIVCSLISIDGKGLAVYGCHLSSNNYSRELEYLTPGEVNSLTDFKTYLHNMASASEIRELEARSIIDTSSDYPCTIVMGDMNDVSGSATLQIFDKNGFKDAWHEGGFGYGATIHHPMPYRLDHILYKGGLKLKGVSKIDTNDISDHDALVAVFDIE